MIIGFTGTRKGMTDPQKLVVRSYLTSFMEVGPPIEAVHHGMCEGADDDFDEICEYLGLFRVGHPGLDSKGKPSHRGCRIPDLVLPAKYYMARNQDIVSACQVLLACPKAMVQQRRSGTWATVRMGQGSGYVLVRIIYPAGTTDPPIRRRRSETGQIERDVPS